LTNILHLGELLQEESRQHKEGTRGLLKWLARKRDEENGKQDEEQLRLESDEELVKIVTMHRSKGLEYPIVFCPFLWYGPELSDSGDPLVYHDPENMNTTYLDLTGKSDPERDRKRWLAAREELAESLRLAYVAMTRAEQCCYLTWIYAGKSEFSPLGYLFQDSETVFERIQETISDKYNAAGSKEIDRRIKELCDQYPGLFTMIDNTKILEEEQPDSLKNKETLQLEKRDFHRPTPLNPSYSVSSFSSLSSWMDDDDPNMPDYDQFMDYSGYEFEPVQEGKEKTMFTFPRGPQPGTCIHNIFENYFSNSGDKDEVIVNQLQLNGIDETWKNTVSDMLDTVLNKSLHEEVNGLSLSAIQDSQIPEMEFYYRNKEVETHRLLSIIRDGEIPAWGNQGKAESGFLKGFIDLTFQFEDKFYLLDYKTNYLGDSFDDYRPEVLEQEMEEASYDLQYHIYTVALHRFLKQKKQNYSYEKDFGGAFYLFLRGMNNDGREGIFFDCPDYAVIRELDEYILSGGKHA
jgi:exodeoxyribonuclease V beta subunit